jgi:gluconate 2-dehydrogenase gamma chain
MDSASLSRRSLLQAIAATMATAAMPVPWSVIAKTLDEKAAPAQGSDSKFSLLSAAEAADIDAVASQIIPTDDSPGAREAGVVYFIDRSLASFFSQLAGDYRAQLATFQGAFRRRIRPRLVRVAARPSRSVLKTVDQTPFFTTTRLLTVPRHAVALPSGGNRSGVGWKLLGFEDACLAAPFGYRSRFPGFVIDPVTAKKTRTYRDSETVDFDVVSGAAGVRREIGHAARGLCSRGAETLAGGLHRDELKECTSAA